MLLFQLVTTIQEVLFFPQMRPEKVVKKDAAAKYMELGIAEDWVPVFRKPATTP